MRALLTACLAVFLIALAVSFLFPRQAPDTARYLTEAQNLQLHGIFSLDGKTPTARDAPGLPLTIYLFLEAGVKDPQIPMRILNALAVGLIAFCCGRIAMSFCETQQKNAWPCGVITALYCGLAPGILGTCLFVLTETMFVALFLLGNTLVVSSLFSGQSRKKRVLLWASAGLCWGLAALYRPVILLYPLGAFPLAALFLAFSKGRSGVLRRSLEQWSAVLAGLAVFAACLVPWAVRNQLAFGPSPAVCVGGGANLYIGASQEWRGDYPEFDPADKLMADEPGSYSRIEADKELGRRAKESIFREPLAWLSLIPLKLQRFWLDVPGSKKQIQSSSLLFFLKFLNLVNLLLCLGGVILCLRSLSLNLRAATLFLLLPAFYICTLHTFLFALPRFRVPIEPYLGIFACVAVLAVCPAICRFLKIDFKQTALKNP